MVYDDDLLNKHDLSSDSCAVLALVFLLFSLEAFMLLHWLRLGGNFLKNPHENVEPFLLFVARRLLSGEFSAQEIRCARANFFGTFMRSIVLVMRGHYKAAQRILNLLLLCSSPPRTHG